MSDKKIPFVDLDGTLGHSASPLEIVSFAEYAGVSTEAREAISSKLAEKPKSDYEQTPEEVGKLFADSLKDKSPAEIQRLAAEWAATKATTKNPASTGESEVSEETLDWIERHNGFRPQKGMPMLDEKK
jgi:hypothetical protein